jgi:GDP-mannose 6-dehydrogenase
MKITIFGLGYVGAVSAACFAKLKHSVVGVDRDSHKVQSILSGQSPFYEPGLQEIVSAAVAEGNLSACVSAAEGLQDADAAFVCVGTPSESNGNLGLDQIRNVVQEIAAAAAGRTKPLVVAIRSTVFPGTCEEVVIPVLQSAGPISVVSNPEFLREGAAVKDFLEPSLLVIGGTDPEALKTVAALYSSLPVEPCLVSLRTAEMIKYSCNAFHAIKIAFSNEIGALSQQMGVDPHEVMSTLCKDEKLNISTAYMKPGFAFGGSCLPKDLRALVFRSRRHNLNLPLLESALPSNEAHLRRAIDQILALPAQKLGIMGLAFKEDTDDLRESPVVTMLEYLIGKGRELRVFDPHIQLANIYGANRNYLLNAIPHIGRLLQPDADSVLGWADQIIVAQKPSKALAAQIRASGRPVIDVTLSQAV